MSRHNASSLVYDGEAASHDVTCLFNAEKSIRASPVRDTRSACSYSMKAILTSSLVNRVAGKGEFAGTRAASDHRSQIRVI